MRWMWLLFLLTRGAVVFFHSGAEVGGHYVRSGGANLGLYAYFAQVVDRGANPYALTGGPVAPAYADYPPLLMGLFGALAGVTPARLGVLLFCLAGDAALFAATLAVSKRRSCADRWLTMALVLCNPAWFFPEVWDVQFKTWIAAGFVALSLRYSAVLAGTLAGAFVLPALIIPMRMREDLSWKAAGVSCAVATVCWAPLFPGAFTAISARRAERLAMTPYGTSLFASVADHWHPWMLTGGAAVAAALVLTRGNTLLRCSAALAVLSLLSPDTPLNRVMPFVLPVLICAAMAWRQRALCFAACLVTYAANALRWSGHYEHHHAPLWLNCLVYTAVGAAVAVAWSATSQTPRQSSGLACLSR